MKGIVVDVKESRAVILKEDGTFENVKNKNFEIGQKVSVANKALANSLRIAACIALCLITSAAAYEFYYTPYSYVYIDINPSIRLDLNYFDVVIGYTPLNDDADFIRISSNNVEDSVNEVIAQCEEKGLLNEENNEIEINVSADDKEVKSCVSNVETDLQNTNYTVIVKDTTGEEAKAANRHGISVKRMRTIDEFTSVFGGTSEENVESLQGKSTAEISNIIRAEKEQNITPGSTSEEKTEKEPVKRPVINRVSNKKESSPQMPRKEQAENKPIVEEKPKDEVRQKEKEINPEQEIDAPPKLSEQEDYVPHHEPDKRPPTENTNEVKDENKKEKSEATTVPEKKNEPSEDSTVPEKKKEPSIDTTVPEKKNESTTDTAVPEKKKDPSTDSEHGPEKKKESSAESSAPQKKSVKNESKANETHSQEPAKEQKNPAF